MIGFYHKVQTFKMSSTKGKEARVILVEKQPNLKILPSFSGKEFGEFSPY